MGALHAGHLALVRLRASGAPTASSCRSSSIRRSSRRTRISAAIRAPGTPTSRRSPQLKVDLVWAPTSPTMYPDGFATRIAPDGPALAGLEDKFRPHFFGGVATVVAKLLLQVAPDFAMFGEKDYQQLKVVTAMARDLDLPVKIVGAADRAREGRPRDVVAQRLSLGRTSARSRRRSIAC